MILDLEKGSFHLVGKHISSGYLTCNDVILLIWCHQHNDAISLPKNSIKEEAFSLPLEGFVDSPTEHMSFLCQVKKNCYLFSHKSFYWPLVIK